MTKMNRCAECKSGRGLTLERTELGRQWRCVDHKPPPKVVLAPEPRHPTEATLAPFGPCVTCHSPHGIVRKSGSKELECGDCALKPLEDKVAAVG